MESLVYPVLALILFVLAFIANRRFGLLGMALATGSLIEMAWRNSAGSIFSALGLYLSPKNISIISIIVILLPAIILIFHGRGCKSIVGRLVSATLFTVTALTLVTRSLSELITTGNLSSSLHTIVINNYHIITGFCLIIAVVDVFLSKSHHSSSKNHKS